MLVLAIQLLIMQLFGMHYCHQLCHQLLAINHWLSIISSIMVADY